MVQFPRDILASPNFLLSKLDRFRCQHQGIERYLCMPLQLIVTDDDLLFYEKDLVSLAIIQSMAASNNYFTRKETTVSNLIQELLGGPPSSSVILDNTGKLRSEVVCHHYLVDHIFSCLLQLNLMSQFVYKTKYCAEEVLQRWTVLLFLSFQQYC